MTLAGATRFWVGEYVNPAEVWVVVVFVFDGGGVVVVGFAIVIVRE